MMEFSLRRTSGSSSASASTPTLSTSTLRSTPASTSSSSSASFNMDQQSPFYATRLAFNSDLDSEEDPDPEPDYVKWQGSQTACQALNQLIRSSVNEPSGVGIGVGTKGRQREPSFDQIPGFSSLSTADASGTSTSTSTSTSAFKQPYASSSRPPSRARPSETKSRPISLSSSSSPNLSNPLPFFDKTNPSQFLDILKGVSARVDENAGVRPRNGASDSVGPIRSNVKKRTRGSSLGSSSEANGGAGGSRVKKGRVEVLRGVKDKGKAREVSLSLPVNGERGPVVHEHEHRMTGSSTPTSTFGISSMDLEADDDMSMTYHPSSPKTPSQTRMPPPPVPRTKHPDAPSTRQNHYEQHQPRQIQESKPVLTPKLHPLLLQPPTNSNSKSSTDKPQPTTSVHPIPKPEPKQHQPQPRVQPAPAPAPAAVSAPSSTPTPHFTNSQSSRPPVLGMRRTHTFPVSGMSTSLQKTGTLPTRQKGFKPPLLSASQPQSRSQVVEPAVAQPQPPLQHRRQHQYRAGGPQAPSSSNGSSTSAGTSPESARVPASSSSSSWASVPSSSSLSTSTSSTRSSVSGRATSVPTFASCVPEFKPKIAPSVPAVAQPPAPAPALQLSPPLPEPTDGDADSSFGDISFDIDADALEETMRMYD